MVVLHINNYSVDGGAETVFEISRQNPLAENFSGFVKRNAGSANPNINFTSWENDNKLKGIINYIYSGNNKKILKAYLRNNKIDVIHLHGFFSSLSPSILKAINEIKDEKKIKVIQTLHDFHLVCPNSSLYNFNKNKICEKCLGIDFKYKIVFENCDRRGRIFSIIKGIRSFTSNNILNHKAIVDLFICPSEFLKSKLIEDGIQETKISVVRNPILFNEKEIPSKKNKIVYFGRFSREKNLSFLINAFTQWKKETKNDFQFILIGDGEEKNFIKNLAAESEFNNDILFKNYVPYHQLADEISDAKYSVMSSQCYENSPMSVIESISLNILPIVPNLGGMKESVESLVKTGAVYDFNDVNSWISGVNKMESNYESTLKNLINIKDSILTNFNTQKYYENLKELYSE